MNISTRIQEVPYSAIRILTSYADEAIKRGKKIYHLNIGAPDISVPDEFFKAISEIKSHVLPYESSKGYPDLIKQISLYYKSKNIDIDPEDIVITNGASEALIFAIMTITDLGDTILTSDPFYTNYLTAFRQCGIKPRVFETSVENGYRLPSYEDIISRVDKSTKAILLSNPSNPTGVVYSKEEVELIARIAIEKDLFIIADEVYREFVFDGKKFHSFGEVKGIEDRLILVDSISKRFGACGARIGSLATKNKDLYKEFVKLCSTRLAVSTVDQIGATELYNVDKKYFEDVNKEYKRRRDLICKELEEIHDIKVYKPQGAFYIMPEIPVDNAFDFSKWLLTDFSKDNKTVMLAPGEGFYYGSDKGKKQVRIAYVINTEDLHDSILILREAIDEYNRIEK
ncbi:pyridoxal phosphate-dependent aminotransferase [Peptoniphilus catoniae]|uniref:pyridoxal phosphate-dependent aminotransferase n=1 Tax=Peptoniphilus catoniae TaxID=1660341 RepID=UPI0010FD292B|nr:pyridoxal phosphate-dependent aminotransferase [Peptoniphilus catoniae]